MEPVTTHPTDAVAVAGATVDQEGPVIEVLTRAFAEDAAVRWLYPDEGVFRAAFPRFVRAFAGASFTEGGAHWIAPDRAAALWLPPGTHPDEEALVTLLEETAAPAHRDAVFAILEQMDRAHPEAPHWHLPLIGVDPRWQGRGLGSRLLAHALAECDRRGEPAYLEASGPRNAALYRRHGFEPIGAIQAGDSPVITPMLRQPR